MHFDRDKYQSTLINLAQGEELLAYPLYVYDEIPSTDRILWELLDRGIEPNIAAIALEQTAGKGQWGRQWQSVLGGLYLSVALSVNLAAENSFHLTVATALGIARILSDRGIPMSLKWPNDLILDRKKLGGIKCETRIRQEKIDRVVIGVGINWTNPTPDVGISLKSFYQNKLLPINSLEELAAVTTYGIISGYQSYLDRGIDCLLPEYLQLLDNLGQTVTINDSLGEIVGVKATGELKIRLRSPGASTEISLPPGQISLGYGIESRK